MTPFAIQNEFTAMPNAVIDYLLPRVSPTAFGVLSLIIRKTVGWGKEADQIPLSQILAGTSIKTNFTALKAVKELEALKVIEVQRGARRGDGRKEANRYALNRGWTVPAAWIDAAKSAAKSACGLSSINEQSKELSLISKRERVEVTVTSTKTGEFSKKIQRPFFVAASSDSKPKSAFGGVMQNQITLSELRSFDPHSKVCGKWERFLCPLCNGGKSRDETHQSFCVDSLTFGFKCHRCDAKGMLGREVDYQPRSPIPAKPKADWRVMWERGRPKPLLGTVGETYLRGRGIDAKFAAQSGVEFAGALCGRAAVSFPVRDQNGVLVAVQGRYVGREKWMRTLGPVKSGVFATAGAWESPRLAVVEAPIDALSFAQMFGIPAIAICGKGLIPEWVLQNFKGELILASDNDEAGDEAAAAWANQAGKRIPTRRVTPRAKDWNAELMISVAAA